MSTPPSRLPALRVKLPCDDEKDFYARLADTIAEKGLRVPTPNLRPIGSRVRFVLEFRNAQTLSGEAIVDSHAEGSRPTMNVRLVKFERSRPGATPAPTAPRPAPTPVPPPSEPAQPAAAAPAPPRAAAPPPETSFASILDDLAEAAEPEPEPEPAPRPPAEGTEELEPLYGSAPAPEPTPPPGQAAPAKPASPPAASRRSALVAAGAAAALVVVILAYSVARRPAGPPGEVVRAPAASAADTEGKLVSRIELADRRISDGRLSGPDGALDHLLAAKALRSDDGRVRDRLRLLADTLEMLGGRALDRGDTAEAEVHLAAALRAAPDRQSIAAKLDAVAKLAAPQDARTRPGAGEKPPP